MLALMERVSEAQRYARMVRCWCEGMAVRLVCLGGEEEGGGEGEGLWNGIYIS